MDEILMIVHSSRRRLRPRPPRRFTPEQKKAIEQHKPPREVIEKALKMEFNVFDAATGKRIYL